MSVAPLTTDRGIAVTLTSQRPYLRSEKEMSTTKKGRSNVEQNACVSRYFPTLTDLSRPMPAERKDDSFSRTCSALTAECPENVWSFICFRLNRFSAAPRPISCSQYASQLPRKCRDVLAATDEGFDIRLWISSFILLCIAVSMHADDDDPDVASILFP